MLRFGFVFLGEVHEVGAVGENVSEKGQDQDGWLVVGTEGSLCGVIFVLCAETAELVAVVVLKRRVVPFPLGLEE